MDTELYAAELVFWPMRENNKSIRQQGLQGVGMAQNNVAGRFPCSAGFYPGSLFKF